MLMLNPKGRTFIRGEKQFVFQDGFEKSQNIYIEVFFFPVCIPEQPVSTRLVDNQE